MNWKGTHLSREGLTVEHAYQSKNQSMRSKELPAELRDRIVARLRSGKCYKTFWCTEDSQEHSSLQNSQMEEVWHNQDFSMSWSP